MAEELGLTDRDVLAELARLSSRLDAQERMIASLMASAPAASAAGMSGADLAGMTVKQHVTLQMLLRGASNAQIADRLGISENGAKVHVRLIGRKLGANTRSQIVMALVDQFREMSAETYRVVAGGLPKDWAENWMDVDAEEDPHVWLYRKAEGDEDCKGGD